MLNQMEPMTLVIVKWRDAVRHIETLPLADIADLHAIDVETSGFLYTYNDEEVVLVNGVFEDCAKDTLIIPTSWVLSVRSLFLTDLPEMNDEEAGAMDFWNYPAPVDGIDVTSEEV